MKRFICPLVLLIAAAVAASPAAAQKDLTIAQIQGIKNVSEHIGVAVKTTGIVTARLRTGFFLQTPDSKIDGDPLPGPFANVSIRCPSERHSCAS
jgi:hypothetical protein